MKWIILDFGAHEIKALKAEMDTNKLTILDFAAWPSRPDLFRGLGFPMESAWAAATIALNENNWISGDEEVIVTAALPSAYLETRYLKFPFRNEKQIEKVLPFELESTIPFDIEDILYRFRLLEGEGVQNLKKEGLALVFSYKRDKIKGFETELRKFQTSLPPISTEILSLSTLRQAITTEPVFAILECGHSKTQFLLLQKSGGILAARTFWWGGEKIIQTIASDKLLDFAKAEAAFWQVTTTEDQSGVYASIEKSINQFSIEFRQTLKALKTQGIEWPQQLPIYVTGSITQTPDFLQKLEELLRSDAHVSVRAFPMDSFLSKNVVGANKLTDPEKALTCIAIGVSQLRIHRGRVPVFSESGFQFQQNLQKFKSSSFSILKKVALLMIAPLVYSLVQFVIQDKESKVIVAKLQETLQRSGLNFKNSESTEEIIQHLKKERAANRSKLEQIAEDQRSPLIVLTEISKKLPTNIKIDVKEFKVTNALVSITAETSSAESAQAIVDSLKELYPKIKMGALSACGAKTDCKQFTFEIEREQEG